MRVKVLRAKYYKCINKQGSPPSLAGYQPITLGGGGYEKVKRKRGKMKSKKEKEERKRVMESIR
jgi:hypothetical protein